MRDVVALAIATAFEKQVGKCVPQARESISEDWVMWVKNVERAICRLRTLSPQTLEALQSWLPPNLTQDLQKSAPPAVMAMRRLSGMLCYTYPNGTQELDDDERKHCRFFAQVPRSSCDLFGPSCASPTLLLVEEDARCMEALHKIRHVQGHRARCGRVFRCFDPHAHRTQVARLEKDGIRIDQQPYRSPVNAALKQTMMDMVDLKKGTQGQVDLITRQKASANALTFAVVHYNGKAGRSGE